MLITGIKLLVHQTMFKCLNLSVNGYGRNAVNALKRFLIGQFVKFFLIESISSIIRPLTLSIRLTANIIEGHLLLTLLRIKLLLIHLYFSF